MNAIFYNDWDNSYIPDILEEIYIKEVYKPFLIGKKDLVIVDVGGNICLTSDYFKKYAKQVYCVEPSSQHQEVIKKFIEFNKIKNITLCPYAIAGKTEKLKFYLNPNSTSHSLELQADPKKFELVQALSFDDFFEKYNLDHIDILKLDPEGEEAKILASSGFIKYAPKVKVIVGEWHAWCNMEKQQFQNMLTDMGYQFKWRYDTKAAVYSAVYMPQESKEVKIVAPPQL